MAYSDKNVLITPNRGSTSTAPKIDFVDGTISSSTSISVKIETVNNDAVLSFSGSKGTLFSLVDSFTGVLYSVADGEGVPVLDVLDDGTVTFNEYKGRVEILSTVSSISSATGALTVSGGVGIKGDLYIGGTIYGNVSGTVLTAPSTSTSIFTLATATTTTHFLTFVDSNNTTSTGEFIYTTSSVRVIPSNGEVDILSTLSSTSTLTGALVVTGGVGIGGNLWVGGTINGTFAGSVSTASTVLTTSTITTSSQFITFVDSNNTTATGETLYTTSSIRVIPSTGEVDILSTLSSTSTLTGALVVTGGVGIGGDLTVGGFINGTANASINLVQDLEGAIPYQRNFSSLYNSFTFGAQGSGQGINLPTNANLSAGTTNDYTWEFWGLRTSISAFNCAMSLPAAGSVILRISGGGWGSSIISIPQTDANTVAGVGRWFHFAISRKSGITCAHINGIQYATTNSSYSFSMSGGSNVIGNYNNNTNQEWVGYLSNIRFTNGYAVYTPNVNFTPSRKPLEVVRNTVLLTGQRSTILDTGPLGLTLTGSGTVAANISPFTTSTSLLTGYVDVGTTGTVLVSTGSAPNWQNTLTLAGTTSATSTTTGALQVVGGVGVGGSLYVGGTIYQGGVAVGSGGTATTSSNIQTLATATTTTHFLTFVDSNNTTSTGESLYTTNTVRVIPSTGEIDILSTLSSTSTLTGALVVTGGVGIGGNLWVGGTINGTIAGSVSTASTVITTATNSTATHFIAFVDANNTASTAEAVYTTSTVVITPNTGNIGVNRVSWRDTAGVTKVYQFYNTLTNSLDTIFE